MSDHNKDAGRLTDDRVELVGRIARLEDVVGSLEVRLEGIEEKQVAHERLKARLARLEAILAGQRGPS